jgi:hypothetical protein
MSGRDYCDVSTDDDLCDPFDGVYFADLDSGNCVDDGPTDAFLENEGYRNCAAAYGGPTTYIVPPPTCDDVLTQQVVDFLATNDQKLLNWDPTLAFEFVAVGEADGVDPRLMASIATLESGHGSVFGGQNNPFGLGPKWNFTTSLAAVQSQGITLKHLIGYGDKTVALLYSGKSGIVDPRTRKYIQPPAYCNGTACPAAGDTVAGFLSTFGSNSSVGLSAGNPSKLGFPCP